MTPAERRKRPPHETPPDTGLIGGRPRWKSTGNIGRHKPRSRIIRKSSPDSKRGPGYNRGMGPFPDRDINHHVISRILLSDRAQHHFPLLGIDGYDSSDQHHLRGGPRGRQHGHHQQYQDHSPHRFTCFLVTLGPLSGPVRKYKKILICKKQLGNASIEKQEREQPDNIKGPETRPHERKITHASACKISARHYGIFTNDYGSLPGRTYRRQRGHPVSESLSRISSPSIVTLNAT